MLKSAKFSAESLWACGLWLIVPHLGPERRDSIPPRMWQYPTQDVTVSHPGPERRDPRRALRKLPDHLSQRTEGPGGLLGLDRRFGNISGRFKTWLLSTIRQQELENWLLFTVLEAGPQPKSHSGKLWLHKICNQLSTNLIIFNALSLAMAVLQTAFSPID